MANRYRLAMAQGREVFERTVREDEALLRQFGLRLTSVQGGIHAAVERELRGSQINPWNIVAIDEKTWTWLHPLLVELQQARLGEQQPLALAAK